MTDNAQALRAKQKIADLERELQEARAKLDEAQKMPPDQALADELHGMLCTWNHTDGCSWYYGSWSNAHLDYARQSWLKKARKALALANGDHSLVLAMVKALR